MDHCAAEPEGQLWVEHGGFGVLVRMAAVGASRPLRRTPAIVSFLNPQPALSLVGGNRSSCPGKAIRDRSSSSSALDPEPTDQTDPYRPLRERLAG